MHSRAVVDVVVTKASSFCRSVVVEGSRSRI